MTRPQPANDSATPRPAAPLPGELRTGTVSARFDPPHPLRTADGAADRAEGHFAASDAAGAAAESASVCPPLPVVPDELREELHRQASEISAHLRREASDVDRREAHMHARLAELEQRARAAELQAKEYAVELQRRCDELFEQERALEERAAELEGAERYWDSSRREPQPHGQSDVETAWMALRTGQQQLQEAQRHFNDRIQAFEQQRMQWTAQLRSMYERLAAQRNEAAQRSLTIKRALARRAMEVERRAMALRELESKLLRQQSAVGGGDRRSAI